MSPRGLVLVLNAGSSSLKYAVVDPARGGSQLREKVERVDESGWDGACTEVSERLAVAGSAVKMRWSASAATSTPGRPSASAASRLRTPTPMI